MRTLRLNKETLAQLSDEELGGLAGASVPPQEYRIPTRQRCADSIEPTCWMSLADMCTPYTAYTCAEYTCQ